MNEEELGGDPVFHYSDATFVGHWWPHFVVCVFCIGFVVLGLVLIENVVRSTQDGYPEPPSGVEHIQAFVGPFVFLINRSLFGPILIIVASATMILGSYLTYPSRASINRQGMIDSMEGIDIGLKDLSDLKRFEDDIREGRVPRNADGTVTINADGTIGAKEHGQD